MTNFKLCHGLIVANLYIPLFLKEKSNKYFICLIYSNLSCLIKHRIFGSASTLSTTSRSLVYI